MTDTQLYATPSPCYAARTPSQIDKLRSQVAKAEELVQAATDSEIVLGSNL